MIEALEKLIAAIWNRIQRRGPGKWPSGESLTLGFRVLDGQLTKKQFGLSTPQRTMHVAILGKTGTGKSSLLRYMSRQDIEADRGFAYFALHGDDVPFLLGVIN